MASVRRQSVDERRRLIIEVARKHAEAGGWASVTTRLLADAIGYTQPVLYGHFPGGKADIMSAVALEGFADLAGNLRAAIGDRIGRATVVGAAEAYLDFAATWPAVYEVMFSLPIGATFGQPDSDNELREGFTALAAAINGVGGEPETTTEVFWAGLHGLAALDRSGRLRPEFRSARIEELATRFSYAEKT